ncbi:uncharacterized protein LOC105025314 isoform X1 [Esox lucius]|uniref:uncharacterized protein LOC105025314 isoform X1 n=2 Tax=Esox lucius TaxID=8010 RepID=UPI00147749E2|nr:uncharacterized protein LOC105025314 isoform X1 [Esox lucius]
MPRCSAYKCSNSTDRYEKGKLKTNNVKLYSFPLREPRRLKQWVDQMRWKAWKPTRHSRVCAEHFEEKYLITSGQGVRLSPDAIPTIFSFPSEFQKKKITVTRKRVTLYAEDQIQGEVPTAPANPRNIGSNSAGLKETHSYLDHSIWHPSRFHDDYCVPQSIGWAVNDEPNEVPPSALQKQGLIFIPKLAIRIKEKWEWLSMEVKGPFRETEIGHTFVLTVMDYYSKWVEAYPMKTTSSKEIAKIISDLISRFGFPVGILSYLSITLIVEINEALSDLKNLICQFICYSPSGLSLDPVTKSLTDRLVHAVTRLKKLSDSCSWLVSDLVRDHPDRWDVHLAASVFSFCCQEHPTTGQTPLSLLRCGGTPSVSISPRRPTDNGIKKTFVILEAEPPAKEVCVHCSQCSEWILLSQDMELKRYEDMKLGNEDYTHTPVSAAGWL